MRNPSLPKITRYGSSPRPLCKFTPPKIPIDEISTQQLFVERVEGELNDRIRECKNEWDQYIVHRDVFAKICSKYESSGCLLFKTRLDDLIESLYRESSEIRNCVSRSSQDSMDIGSQQGKIEKKREKMMKLKNDIVELIGDLESENSLSKKRVNELQTHIKDIKSVLKEKSSQVDDLCHQKDHFEGILNELRGEDEKYEATLNQKKREEKEAHEKIMELLEESYKKTRKIEAINEKISSIQHDTKHMEFEIERLIQEENNLFIPK